jgi:hypothetical protein
MHHIATGMATSAKSLLQLPTTLSPLDLPMQSRSFNDNGGFANPPPSVAGEDRGHHDTVVIISSDRHGDTAGGDQIELRTMDAMAASEVTSPNATSSNYRNLAGYERLSRLMNSDNDFLVFRKFGELNVRNILYLQDRLSDITEKLAREDEKPDPKPGTRRWDDNRTRADLLQNAEGLLQRYSKAI